MTGEGSRGIPGFYIHEVSPLAKAITPVETALPAFIGCTERALGAGGEDLTGTPVWIASVLDYERVFGAVPRTPTLQNGVPANILPHAIELYFANGGGRCAVLSLGAYSSGTESGYRTALGTLESHDNVTLLLFPDAVSLGEVGYAAVVDAALTSCARKHDRFTIIDVPNAIPGGNSSLSTVRSALRDRITNDVSRLKFGAAYFPYLDTTLPSGVAGVPLRMPASPAVAGIYARVDRDRGVWKAPANESIALVSAPACQVSSASQGELNVDIMGGKSINAIREFPGRGVLVWGARTLAGNDAEWRYVSVRRTMTFLEVSIARALASYVMEPNVAATWTRAKQQTEEFLHQVWRSGALMGSKQSEAYFAHVGLGQTMTQADVAAGRMSLQIGVACMRPAEFIVTTIVQQVTG